MKRIVAILVVAVLAALGIILVLFRSAPTPAVTPTSTAIAAPTARWSALA
jgi:hypothetical protein